VRPIFLLCPTLLLSACLQKPPGLDQDGDGYAFPEDCDDDDDGIHPGAEDTWYDGADQNCDGHSDFDQDGDGHDDSTYGDGDDCNDTDASVHPDATEQWYDGIDQDCDGHSDFDKDGDGYDSAADTDGNDCDDGDFDVNPGATEIWYDGTDQDCDGADDYDQDRDGFPSDDHGGTDCDDLEPGVHPDAQELLNGVDDNCDERIDEVPWAGGPTDVSYFHGGITGEESTFSGLGYAVSEFPIDLASALDLGTSTLDVAALSPDGLPDLLVSAPLAGFFGGVGDQEQAVYLIPGGSPAELVLNDVADRTLLRLDAGDEGGWFGSSIAWVPSIDGDDAPEILVGAPTAGPAATGGAGKAFLFFSRDWGDASSVPSEGGGAVRALSADLASVHFESDTSGDGFGAATSLGDLDQDGGGDIAITIPELGGDGYSPGQEPGAIAIYASASLSDGDVTWLDAGAADVIIHGSAERIHLGQSLPVVTDLDGSGSMDLVVSAPGADGDKGWVSVWLGESISPIITMPELDYQLEGTSGCQQLGQRIASGADLNGDGYPETGLMCSDSVGDPIVRVVSGDAWAANTDTTVAEVTLAWVSSLTLPTGVDTVPFSLHADFNQDSYADLVVGSPTGEPDQGDGLVTVFYGGASFGGTYSAAAGESLISGQDSSWLGYTSIEAMDLDGDTWPELILGAPGYDTDEVAGLHRPGAVYLLNPLAGW
jgi:hypothetical protein